MVPLSEFINILFKTLSIYYQFYDSNCIDNETHMTYKQHPKTPHMKPFNLISPLCNKVSCRFQIFIISMAKLLDLIFITNAM